MAALVPPPRKHVVRYYGALGPQSPLRSAVTEVTRGGATLRELESGYSEPIAGKTAREVRKAASAAKRAWAACLRKIFEVDPVRCEKCGGGMQLAAVILDDRELDRILAPRRAAASFSAGTVSGAPKVSAGEIIAGLERPPQGSCAGAAVQGDFARNLDSCLAPVFRP